MLSPADLSLIQREEGLPGLATLLEPEAFLDTLRPLLPGLVLESPELAYLRYKPATNCLAGFQVTVGNQRTYLYAKAHHLQDTEKLAKAALKLGESEAVSVLGVPGLILPELSMSIYGFPHDRKLHGLPRLASRETRARLLKKLSPETAALRHAALHVLRYKAERRLVGQLLDAEQPRAALKLYGSRDFGAARDRAAVLADHSEITVAPLLGACGSQGMLVFKWVDGQPLDSLLADAATGTAGARAAGAALARLHRSRAPGLTVLRRDTEAARLLAAASAVGFLLPGLAKRAHQTALELGATLLSAPYLTAPIHGDFSADQVVVQKGGVTLLDFDEAAGGDPAADVGSFIGQLRCNTVVGDLDPRVADTVINAFLDGYGEPPPRTGLYVAVSLIRLAPHTFRRREPAWAERLEHLLSSAAATLAAAHKGRRVVT